MSRPNEPESDYEEAVARVIRGGFADPRRSARVSRYLEFHRNAYKRMCADPSLSAVERERFTALCRKYL